jgi:23S rRNA (uracil1939-C5)-methyltransferase
VTGVQTCALPISLGAGEGHPLFELYAGAGNLTRALVAAGWRVTATDVAAPAQPLAGVEWITADAAAAMRQLVARRAACAACVLDPPRTGAREILEPLAALGAGRIVYVSCDAATLARDALALERLGYRAVRAQPIDTMPQTSHLEIVLTFERLGSAASPP